MSHTLSDRVGITTLMVGESEGTSMYMSAMVSLCTSCRKKSFHSDGEMMAQVSKAVLHNLPVAPHQVI